MELVESIVGGPSVRAQCRLLSVSRSGHYYEASNAAQLSDVFNKIATQLGDLRVTK